jgi:hypothetical protein
VAADEEAVGTFCPISPLFDEKPEKQYARPHGVYDGSNSARSRI